MEAGLRLRAAASGQRYCGGGPALLQRHGVGAGYGGVQGRYWGVGAAWGLHLNGRRMYLSYFVLVNAHDFVLVDDRLIWYLCWLLVMSLLQH